MAKFEVAKNIHFEIGNLLAIFFFLAFDKKNQEIKIALEGSKFPICVREKSATHYDWKWEI